MPEFEMKVIKAYNVLQGVNTYENISSWFDALDDMKCQMESIDYDVALWDAELMHLILLPAQSVWGKRE